MIKEAFIQGFKRGLKKRFTEREIREASLPVSKPGPESESPSRKPPRSAEGGGIW